jgi:FkbM family methyltransferase
LDIGTLIDVGASNGMWSAVAEAVLPDAKYLLIEAQEYHREALESYCLDHAGASYVLAAAGDQNGEIFFDDRSPFGGVASKEATSYARRSVPMYSIDHLVSSRGMSGPFLVKLDTHGFEVPILDGAVETLKSANLVVIEVYNFRILDSSLLFHEMCALMRERGFGVIDVSEPLWRAKDDAFWQMDFFFIPLDRKEFDSSSYE